MRSKGLQNEDDRSEGIENVYPGVSSPSTGEDFEMSNSKENGVESHQIEIEGDLYKWTNIFYGWKQRYVVLRGAALSYYMNKEEENSICRGSFNIRHSQVENSKYDELAFVIKTSQSIIHFRTDTPEQKEMWIQKLLEVKKSSNSPDKCSRTLSMSSALSTLSLKSGNLPSKQGTLNLSMRISEMEAFKDQIYQQIDLLRNSFELLTQAVVTKEVGLDLDDTDDYSLSERSDDHRLGRCPVCEATGKLKSLNIDFIGEAIAFRAATSGMMATMKHCIETINMHHDSWKQAFTRLKEKKNSLHEKYTDLYMKYQGIRSNKMGPEFEEGPCSRLNEEEFFDAIDTAYEIEDEQNRIKEKLKEREMIDHKSSTVHRFSDKVFSKRKAALDFLTESIHADQTWEMCLNSQRTKIYKKNVEVEEFTSEPYRVTSIIEGVTAKELSWIFFDPEQRLQWDQHCDNIHILERFNENEVIVHQIHKHVWPAKRRDTCVFSYISVCDENLAQEVKRTAIEDSEDFDDYKPIGRPWSVVNFSVDHEDASCDECIRATADVGIIAQSFIRSNANPKHLTRNKIITRMNYFAVINLGGWLPPSAVRRVSQREFPKFIDKFGSYVVQKCSKTNLDLH